MRDKSRWGNMPYSLGGWLIRKDPKGKLIDGEASTWKPGLGVVKATIGFTSKTGQLELGWSAEQTGGGI